MTIKLRARVKRWASEPGPDAWTVVAWCLGTDAATGHQIATHHRFADAPSHPEAMQAAYKLLADLDAELMSEVHESRASRRTRCECGPGIHSYHCPRHERHELMEPTA